MDLAQIFMNTPAGKALAAELAAETDARRLALAQTAQGHDAALLKAVPALDKAIAQAEKGHKEAQSALKAAEAAVCDARRARATAAAGPTAARDRARAELQRMAPPEATALGRWTRDRELQTRARPYPTAPSGGVMTPERAAELRATAELCAAMRQEREGYVVDCQEARRAIEAMVLDGAPAAAIVAECQKRQRDLDARMGKHGPLF